MASPCLSAMYVHAMNKKINLADLFCFFSLSLFFDEIDFIQQADEYGCEVCATANHVLFMHFGSAQLGSEASVATFICGELDRYTYQGPRGS